jgi:hypothetical protein
VDKRLYFSRDIDQKESIFIENIVKLLSKEHSTISFEPTKLDLFSVGIILLYMVTLGDCLEKMDLKDPEFIQNYFQTQCEE